MSDSEEFDDFDEFNEYAEHHSFGSFEEELVELDKEHEIQIQDHEQDPDQVQSQSQSQNQKQTQIRTDTHNIIKFEDNVFKDESLLQERIALLLAELFPLATNRTEVKPSDTEPEILSDRSKTIYEQVSFLPHLRPPNWVKLKTRRHLLTKLGVPVNLDEILDTPEPIATNTSTSTVDNSSLKPVTRNRRTSLVSEININWGSFIIPEFESLNFDQDQEKSLRLDTLNFLSVVEIENLDHSSTKQLLLSATEEEINTLLAQHKSNYNKLLDLSSVWQNRLLQLKKDYEIYESVVQNLVGHTQRLQREDILASLNKVKSSSKKFR